MKEFTKFTACLFLVLGFLSSDAEAQNPTGDRTWPLWTKPGQGTTVVYGAVQCSDAASGEIFLAAQSNYRTSLIIVNTHATATATICPTGSKDAGGDNCAITNGLALAAGAAVTLDRSILAAPSGFSCFSTGSATIRYWAEQ
jgi:hypothetical protein